MCSGKSTAGRLLARRLSLPFIDLDELIREREGLTVPQIFALKGEPYFRALELKLLRRLLGRPAVVATGGGLGARPYALALMRKAGLVIYLDAPFSDLIRRCSDQGRPLLKQSLTAVKRLYERRRSVYLKADLKVDARRPPEAVVREILLTLKRNAL
ncbi:MAG: shikimate kinase [Aquificae bacterium]|nr:shikimate kinase [Aquificota bacterium]